VTPDDPLARLLAVHRRIEQELAALERFAGDVAQRGADALAQSQARALSAYFDAAAAQHHADEDEVLFPLLRARAAAAGRTEVAAAIDELEREHGVMEALWRRLRDALADIAAVKGTRLPAEEVERFAWLYRRHLEREDLLILPFAREVLSAGDLAGLRR
jgi:hemerythrin-like domain-containing protein